MSTWIGEENGVGVDAEKVPISGPSFQKMLESPKKSITSRLLRKAVAGQSLHWQECLRWLSCTKFKENMPVN